MHSKRDSRRLSSYPLHHHLLLTSTHCNATVTTALPGAATLLCLFARYVLCSTRNLRHNGLSLPADHSSKDPEEFIITQTKFIMVNFLISLNQLNYM